MWGVAPIFWKLLGGVPAVEQTAHRVVWAVPILALAVVGTGRVGRLNRAVRQPGTVGVAALGAALLAANWCVFVWAVSVERIVEASLGYFINPLLSVALGVAVLGERLRPAGVAAVGLAGAGVAYMTFRQGEMPWIALVLAGTFAVYGLLKKRPEAAPPLEGLLAEATLAAVPALAFIVILSGQGRGAFGAEWGDSALLVAAGAVTAIPLLLFGAAAQRIPLSTVGLLQYLAPSLQFMVGAVVYGEPVAAHRMIGFGFVWLALAVFTADNLRASRRHGPAPAA